MCLRTKQKEPKIAQEDITCYKVLEICNPEWEVESGRKRKSKKTVFGSIYYPNFKWSIDKRYRSRLVIEPTHIENDYAVTKAFHAYQTLEFAKSYYKTVSVTPCVIVRCIIPKGSKYYEGIHTVGGDGYASNQMVIKEIVDFKEIYPDFDFDKYPYKQGQLLLVSDPPFLNSDIRRVTNVIPLSSNTVRLRLGILTYDTDINGIPVSTPVPSFSIQIHNDKETK